MYTHTISVLQDKLGACRTQLKQQDGMVEQLQADLQMSVGEIQFWKEQQVQEAGKFKKVKNHAIQMTFSHSLSVGISQSRT